MEHSLPDIVISGEGTFTPPPEPVLEVDTTPMHEVSEVLRE